MQLHGGSRPPPPPPFWLPLLMGSAASPALPCTRPSPTNPSRQSGAEPVTTVQGGLPHSLAAPMQPPAHTLPPSSPAHPTSVFLVCTSEVYH